MSLLFFIPQQAPNKLVNCHGTDKSGDKAENSFICNAMLRLLKPSSDEKKAVKIGREINKQTNKQTRNLYAMCAHPALLFFPRVCWKFHHFKFPFIDKKLSGLKRKAQIFRRKNAVLISLALIGFCKRVDISYLFVFFFVPHICVHTLWHWHCFCCYTRECAKHVNAMKCVQICARTHTHTDVVCARMCEFFLL